MTTSTIRVQLFTPTDPRLRRHVVHDERSRAYALPERDMPAQRIAWPRQGPILDQGEIGSCTANAALGLLMTAPYATGRVWTEDDALALYHEESILDDPGIPGVYPPDDTGSSGLAAMKALQARGLIDSYRHAFTLSAALAALAQGPIAVGSVWLESMFELDRDGVMTVDRRSGLAGGHEYVVDGWDPATQLLDMTNSWGTSWGRGGRARIRLPDFRWLMGQEGDVVQPTMPATPTPSPTPPPDVSADAALAAAQNAWRAAKGIS